MADQEGRAAIDPQDLTSRDLDFVRCQRNGRVCHMDRKAYSEQMPR
jgi:hypothetical protein